MKVWLIISCLISMLLIQSLYGSYVENFIVKAEVIGRLSEDETNKIVKKYGSNNKFNYGIEIKIMESKAQSGSHIKKRFEKGEIIKIVVSSYEKIDEKIFSKGSIIHLEYDYYDDVDTDGKIIYQQSWTLKK